MLADLARLGESFFILRSGITEAAARGAGEGVKLDCQADGAVFRESSAELPKQHRRQEQDQIDGNGGIINSTTLAAAGSKAHGVHKLVERHEIAEHIEPVAPPQLKLFLVDKSKATDTNPDQEALPENEAFMAAGLTRCREALQQAFQGGTDVFQHDVLVDLHAPVYTCEQAHRLCNHRTGVAEMKNLFLKDKKKRFFLVSALVETELKLNSLPFGKSPGFASADALREKLGLLPGSVTPLGLLADAEAQEVEYYLDAAAVRKYNFIAFHPHSCAATVTLQTDDFIRFIERVAKHRVHFLES